ncbi:MAG: mechanosensitive ion channel [Sideroxydans sp.]|nr:mechanosensitive ion channel [Sideroxydans sp.]
MAMRIFSVLCFVACALGALPAHAKQGAPSGKLASAPLAASAPQAASSPAGFPVQFAGVQIIEITGSPIASLSPESRAQLILKNIQNFADGNADVATLKVSALAEGQGIGGDGAMLMIVTARDAEIRGKSAEALAGEILGRIRAAVTDYRTQRSWHIYGFASAFFFLALIGLWLALHWNNKAFVWLTGKVLASDQYWKKGIHFKGVELFSSRRLEGLLLAALKLLRTFIVLLCLYVFLLLSLGFFPETRQLRATILEYLLKPFATIFHNVIGYIPNLFYIFVIGFIAFYILKLIAYIFRLIERGELKFDWFYADWARPTYQIVRFLVIVTALISAYPYIPGSSSQAFQGVSLVLGAIISFASSSAISNIVAGIILTYTRAFKLNDRIKVGDTEGDVVEKTLLVTRINTIKHVIVTIPNSLVMGAQIINFSTSAADGGGVILHTTVTIGYDVPWKQVRDLLIEAALATEKILPQPAPFVLQTSLDDYYVSYEINAYTKEPQFMANIYSDMHRNILDKFDAAGVEIMSPHYYALRDGNASTVNSVAADSAYQAPAFRVGTVPDGTAK